jgi:FAD/FMN-containing dehydrogenase
LLDFSRLREKLFAAGCILLEPNSEAYARVVRLWNGAVNRRPALVARCVSAAQVQVALVAAQEQKIEISVRAGGHDWAGRALREDGLVIDLSGMQNISVNPDAKEVTVQAGATSGEVCAATAQYGLNPVTGNVGAVSFVGLLLGGGYGPLVPRYGLAADNLLEAEIVLADGRIVRADKEQNADLFWAIRGGGGNFGVVTSVKVRLHEVRSVLSGQILFPWTEAQTVLARYAEMMATAPDELFAAAALSSTPAGDPILALIPTWSGAEAEGQPFIDKLRNLGKPILSNVGMVPYRQILTALDARLRSGLHYVVATRWISELTPDAISTLLTSYEGRISQLSIVVLVHFRGAGARVLPGATAFGLREEHFLTLAYSTWDPAVNPGSGLYAQWAEDFSEKLKPFSLPGGFANVLASDAHEQISHAYGKNAERLLELKRRFDPGNVFSSTIPLPTRAWS